MFQNPRRSSFENRYSCSESPIVVSSLTPYVPTNTSARDEKYNNQYVKLKHEFRTASSTRQNTATLTNNFSPTKRECHINKKSIVFPEYEAQKQCLYVRPKGSLQVDPSRFQITPSELTMLRGKHDVALKQVDVSTATGEVRRLETPATSMAADNSMTLSSFKLPSTPSSPGGSLMQDSLADIIDDQLSTGSSLASSSRQQRKAYVIPLPHNTIYNSTCKGKNKTT
jgi:hypothetical protein